MLEQIGSQFLKVAPEAWKSSRNAQAAVLFVLNGGSPTVIRKVIDLKDVPEVDRSLMVGALAYVGGREQQAIDRFSHVDPTKLPEVLGGNVALAMGSLLIRHDPAKAIRLFSIARLLLPGTLIEEAALRRQAFIHFEQNDLDSFAKYSAQYLRRYGKSVYSMQFRERLDLAAKQLAQGDDPAVIQRLAPLFEQTGDTFPADLLLLFAREALTHGRLPVANAALARLQALEGLTEQEQARLSLYKGFSQIFSDEPEKAHLALAEAGPRLTSAEDRWIVEAGARLLGQVVLWPPAVPTNPAEAGRESTGIQGDAAKALLASSELLARADK
jgi:chemotaxis protein MotC